MSWSCPWLDFRFFDLIGKIFSRAFHWDLTIKNRVTDKVRKSISVKIEWFWIGSFKSLTSWVENLFWLFLSKIALLICDILKSISLLRDRFSLQISGKEALHYRPLIIKSEPLYKYNTGNTVVWFGLNHVLRGSFLGTGLSVNYLKKIKKVTFMPCVFVVESSLESVSLVIR